MTGYLLLTNGDASFARSGWFANIRAARFASVLSNKGTCQSILPALGVEEKARLVVSLDDWWATLGLAKTPQTAVQR
jgi:hypothetical protein